MYVLVWIREWSHVDVLVCVVLSGIRGWPKCWLPLYVCIFLDSRMVNMLMFNHLYSYSGFDNGQRVDFLYLYCIILDARMVNVLMCLSLLYDFGVDSGQHV